LGGSDASVDFHFLQGTPPQTVEFDFAWSVAGSPWATPDYVEVYLEDSESRGAYQYVYLGNTFTGLGGFDGYADRIRFDAAQLYDDYSGEPFVDISYMYLYVDAIVTGGPASEFGIDNLSLDGGVTEGGELFPSVNQGAIDVSNSILVSNVLRGSGHFGMNFEVTNGTNSNTTYSTELLPGGELLDAGQVHNAPIAAGQIRYTPDVVSIDRSWSSGEYASGIRLINTGNPQDPDNVVTLMIRIVEPPVLSGPGPVHVSGQTPVQLANAAAPGGGFRASVKVTAAGISGPFALAGLADGTPVKPGQTAEGVVSLNRFGLLSGDYAGVLTAAFQMTMYSGVNQGTEVFLHHAEAVASAQWPLDATLADTLTDSVAYSSGDPLGPGVVGVNNATTAATLLAGNANSTGSVSMGLVEAPAGASTGVIRKAADVDFTTAVPVHVVQMTYRDVDLCSSMIESNLRLLAYNDGAADWKLAVSANSGGGGAAFFSGPFEAFAQTLNGAPLSSALGAHGLDTAANQVWAVVNHDGLFGVGEIGKMCVVPGDLDHDGDVDQDDAVAMGHCMTGASVPRSAGCEAADLDHDNDVDQSDFGLWQRCYSGADGEANPACLD
jgi:hypothetical protein